MRFLSTILLLLFGYSLNAQTFNGTGGGIPDDGLTPTCFNIAVTGVGTINGSYGVASVCLNITHDWVEDLEIKLRAPDGTLIPLSIQNGGSGVNYTGTCFTGTAVNPIIFATAPFTGSYKAEGTLGNVNNGQNANGTWSLCIQDIATPDAGTLVNWNITFNNAPAQPLAPPANDEPCNAATLTVNSTCTYSSNTTIGATNSANADPGCGNYQGSDVWFKVTVPAGGALNFDTQTGVITDGGMAIYSGANCNALTLISCDDDASPNGLMPMILATGLTPGSTIWVRFWEYGNDNAGTFGICVTAPVPPPPLTNDNPCTAIPLTATTSCSYTTFTNAGATGTTGVPAPGCSNYAGGDIWFTVTVPAGGALTIDTQEGTLSDGGMAIYSGSNCNTLTLITCNDDGSNNGGGFMPKIAATGLTPGSTVWVRFWEYANDDNGTFGICVTIPVPPPTCSSTAPAGNTCSAATPICNFNGYCGNTSATYTADYWTELFDAFDACLGGGTSIENNAFISFVASATSASFNVWVSNSLFGDGIQLMFYSGGCGSGPVTCHGGYNNVIDGPNLISASGLVPGNTYYLMIDGVAGDVCDYAFDPITGVDALNVNPDIATICAGSSINLSASGGNGTYAWSPAAGLSATTGANVTATPATSRTYTVTSTGTGLCPVTLTKQVYITVTTAPAAPATSPVTYCVGATASALTATGSSLLWYTAATGGTGSSTAPVPSTASADTTIYYVSQSNGSCESPRAAITVMVRTSTTSTTNVSVCPAQLPYNWNGNNYNAAGSFSVTLTGSSCDSIATLNLTLKANTTSTTNISVCPVQLPYNWNGNNYNGAGSFVYHTTNASGCDSAATLNLTLKVNTTSTTNASVCPAQLPYNWNGNNYNAAGSFVYHTTNAAGCDSAATLNLTLKANTTSTTNTSICPAQLPYNWNGNNYNAAGSFVYHTTNAAGCDSAATLNLTLKANTTSTTNTSICPAQLPYNWNGNNYNGAGSFVYHTTNAAGCDSAATLNLTLKANTNSTTNTSICPAQLPYNWNGNNYNAAGSFVYHTTNAAGCDSAATLNLTLKTNTTSTTNISVCPAQLPYNWNGNNYNGAGSFVYHTTNTAGCDSAATLNLTLKTNTTSTTNISVCSAQLPYNWNGNNYNAAGSFAVTLVNAAGCDSVATLNLTLKANTTSTTSISVCPAQLPYNWNGNNYNAAGSFAVTLVGSSGCDSVATLNLTLKANTTSTTNISVCPAQLPYNWNGNNYNAAGNFSVTLVNAAGCDSVATLNLTLKANTTSTTNISVCPAQLPYNWNGNNYNAAGSFVYHTTNAAGCDSAATLNLTLKTNTTSTTNISVCPAQLPYNWNGNNYNAAGSFSVTLVGSSGCDSVATLNLSLKTNTTSTTNISVCPTQLPYNWNGNNYNAAGSFSVTLVGSSGCDSVATLNLSLKTNTTSITNISVCPTQLPYNWNGNNYNAAGSFVYHTTNAAGCDSAATLNLTLKTNTTSTTNVSVCPTQLPYNWNGNNYNAAGSFVYHTTNAAGCDSAATLNLTLKANTTSTTNASVCPAQLPYNWNGNNYNAAGSFVYHTTNAAGCDSAATLNLTLKANTTSTTNASVCPSQLPYNWNGNNYNAAGSFSVTLTNVAGCDSVATLNLTLKINTTSNTNTSVCPSQLPYNWNGNNYNAAGSFSVTLVGSSGCDSVATLNLSLKTNTTSTTNISICPSQLPYNWNGNNYNAAGSFSVTLTNAAGCDSVATLNLTLKTNTTSTTNISVCPAQLPYNWNGNNYNAAGSFSVTLVGSSGCDSIATLNLTLKANTTSTTNISVCPAQLPYNWNGNNYNAAGSFAATLTNAAGCDSVATLNLTLKANTTSTTNISVCPAQLPYNWNGNNYNAAGSFAVTLTNAAGCDSVATLNLTLKANTTSTTNASVCPTQLPYNWNGNNYNAAGSFSVTLVGSSGCDSVATLNLSLKTNTTSITNISVCPTQLPYNWNGNNYNAAGSFVYHTTNAAGCDSAATLNLTLKANTTSTTNVSVCPAQLPYNWNGNNYNAAGSFVYHTTNAAGCDSAATLNLALKINTTSTTNTSVCPAQLPYNWNGNNYNAAGSFSVTLTNAAGCDSVAALNLTLKTNTTSTTSISVCPAQLPYNWNGNNYNAAGSFSVTLVGSSGCDSVATLNLSLKINTTSTTNISVCPAQLPYNWNGNNYNAAGSFAVTLVGSSGCDSVATLNLTLKANTTSTTNISVCPAQLPYNWNGNNYNAAGNFSVTLVNAAGCDSVATLNLTLKANTTSTTNISVCPAQLPYNWNGNNYNAAGSFAVTLVGSSGCDSVATLNLSLKINTTSTTNISVCPAQLPYNWNGNNYNAAGSFAFTLTNAAGCDSVATLNLSVKTNTTSTTNISVCPAQLPYNWNGNNYNAAGSFAVTLTNADGCDSVATLNLTLKANTTSTTNISVCPAQLPYNWNGNNYNAAGSFAVTLVGSSGCDSVATLNLAVKTNTTSTTNTSVCPAQLPYNWNGNNYNAAGSFSVTLTNAAGCDSVATLNLTLKTNTTSTTNISVCPSQLPYNWNGNNYNAAGSFAVTLVGSSGCDSVATLNLTLKANTTSTTNISVCPAQLPYNWNGNNYNAAGSFAATLTNAAGCDSVATLNLTLKTNTTSTTNISVCPAQLPYNWNGNNYNAAGSFAVTLVGSSGCDSVATLNLAVKTNTTSTTNTSVCPAQLPYNWNGNNYNAAGSFSVTLTNAAGCDSVATLNLTLKTNTTSTTNISVCPSQLPYNWNGNNYNAAGSFSVTLTNAAGCDSVATLNLSIKTETTSTTNISVCAASLPYVWNGNPYNAAASYVYHTTNAAGCDSAATLILTVNNATNSTTSIGVCTSQLPYSWNGNSYNSPGTYNIILTNANGCDSVATLNLSVSAVSTTTTNADICQPQLPYNWNGNNYNSAGTYSVTLPGASGCDSVATLILTVAIPTTSITNASTCAALLPYSWNGNTYNSAGSFVYHTTNAAGCDSAATLNLSILTETTSVTNVSVCAASLPYVWNGNNYNAAGAFVYHTTNAAGCDSAATLNLSILTETTSTTNVSVCTASLPYVWNGNNYNAAGAFVYHTNNIAGCDSAATLVLTVNSATTSTTNIGVCPSQLPYLWNGNNYNAAGAYNATLSNAAGCDSIATLNLSVSNTSTTTTNASICQSQLPYTWNGNSYNTAGSYSVNLTGTSGCDSVATLNLTVANGTTSVTDINICTAALPYLWNGNPYSSSGTYLFNTTNAAGCDSVATLHLVVSTETSSASTASVCAAALPYTWNGNAYNTPGVYTYHTTNNAGCDSLATLTLTVNSPTASTTNIGVCPSQLPYNWNGNVYNSAGSYTVTLLNAAGCDSVATLNLAVNAVSSSTENISICQAQLPYNWNGNTYATAGSYNITLPGSSGCDSVVTLVLTVNSITNSTTNTSICPTQLPYNWNGNIYNTAGAYTVTLTNAAGCDSVATLNLTVSPAVSSTTNITICNNQLPYNWNGNNYNAAGAYNVTLVSTGGCDSIATLNLAVNNTITSTTNITICNNQLPYNWNGNNYNAAGSYNATLVSAAGCDSIATLNLAVNNTITSTTDITICNNQLPYSWNGNNYNAAGAYNATLVSTGGCDSIATLNLSVNNTITSTTDITICNNQLPYNWNGNNYNAAGAYNATLVSSGGCDSIATLNLAVNNTITSTTNITICNNQLPYNWNGNNYNAAGAYNATLVSAGGCDSIATLNLSVNNTITSTIDITICNNQLPYNWNGNNYNAAGAYNATLVSAGGCDSIATLNLTVTSETNSVTNTSVCAASLPYRWNGNNYNTTGNYTYHTTNAAGCDSTATLNLIINPSVTSSTDITICPAQLPYNWNGNLYNAAGAYTATLVSAAGCDSVATLNLTINSTVFSNTDIVICTSQLPYNWNGNSYAAAGTYNVTLTNIAGCDSIATLNLAVNNTVTSTTDIAICNAQLPYSWNGNTYNAAGSYNATFISIGGCDSVATLNLTVNNATSSTNDITICNAQLPYSWNGNTYNNAGAFSVTLVNAAGCDSVATLNLTVNNATSSTTDITICNAQLPYSWNGNTYNNAGAFSVTLANAAGCDSVATLNLTVNAVVTSTTNIAICIAQLPYLWNGNTYNAAGSYNATLVSASGCDSVATLNLSVNNAVTSNTDIAICSTQLPYSWNGNSCNAAGTYSVTLVNVAGCDSIASLNLTVSNVVTSNTDIAICSTQLPYIWNGNSYNAAGAYNANLLSASGCDSIATLNLTVNNVVTSNTDITICSTQLPYIWNGNSYNAAGAYNANLLSASGCDSIATLNLAVSNAVTSNTDITICSTQLPYIWNGNSYNAAGAYNANLLSASGCDSIATLNLAVSNAVTSNTDITICSTQLPYLWNGNSYNAAGLYNVTLISASGCDSIATLNLFVNSVVTSTTEINICPVQLPYSWNGNSYSAAGLYNAILVSAAGCDSVATLNLTVSAVVTSTTDITICTAQLPYSWNGNIYNSAGVYNLALVNIAGCDSIATLNLTVNDAVTSTTNITICNTQLPYNWNGNLYNTTGAYTVTLISASGCDSIATLNLAVNNSTASTTNTSICSTQLPYLWNGNTYNAAGSFNTTLVNANGCDSIATLNLTINNSTASSTDVTICNAQLPYSWNANTYTAAGSFNVTLVNANGCDSVATLNLTVNNAVTSNSNINICPAQLPYSWNGNSYNGAGLYNATLISASGCDSIATLNLTVSAVVTSTTNVAICNAQLPYLWNGNTYNAVGSYNKTLVSASGCDSVATLNLAVLNETSSVTNASVCAAALPYTWNGNSYNAAGAYVYQTTNAAGCDSVATLNLAVKNETASTTNISICPAQLPYNWNGNTYNSAGSYHATLVNAIGCDSIATLILSVKANTSSTTNISICTAQLPYHWNGNNYNAAGSYVYHTTNAVGCDSTATLSLVVKANTASTTNIAVCPAQIPYNWNGNNYNAAGAYSVTLTNAAGCDSIATLNLAVKTNTTSTTNVAVCPGQLPYNWNGNNYNAAGTYVVTIANATGCDSVATLILSVKTNTASTTNITVCPAQLPYKWNGNNYNAGGSYVVTIANAAGCDSVATLQLFVAEAPVVTLGKDTGICPGEKILLAPGSYNHYLWQDLSTIPTYTATQEGYYNVTVTNTQGCEATAGLYVKVISDCGDIFFPNAIAPSGVNRTFGPMGNLRSVSNYSLYIYNRYGELVFSTHDPQQRWDAIYKLKLWGNTNFVWYCDYMLNGKQKRKQRGNLLVVK